MNFGEALAHMKGGGMCARDSWITYGHNALICLSPGCDALEAEKFWAKPNQEFAELCGGKAKVLPYLSLITKRPSAVIPWIPTHEDLLAEDWATGEWEKKKSIEENP